MKVTQLISWENETPLWVADPPVLDPNTFLSRTTSLPDLMDLFNTENPNTGNSVELAMPVQFGHTLTNVPIRILGLTTSKENPNKAYFASQFYLAISGDAPEDIDPDEDPWSDDKHDQEVAAEIKSKRVEDFFRRVVFLRGSVFLASKVPLNKDEEETVSLLAEDQLNKKAIDLQRFRKKVEYQRKTLALGATDTPRQRRNPPDSLVKFIMERDEFCQQCGSYEDLQLDHIIPVSRGGNDSEENLRLLCGACNKARGDLSNL